MTVEEVKEAVIDLDREIERIIQNFEANTGMKVEGIDVDHSQINLSCGQFENVNIQTHIRLK